MKEEIAYIVVKLDVRVVSGTCVDDVEYEADPEILGVYINDPEAAEARVSEYNNTRTSGEVSGTSRGWSPTSSNVEVICAPVHRKPSARQQWKAQKNS